MRPLCLIPHLHNAWTSLCDTWHTTMPFCSEHICQLYIDQIYNTRWRHLAIKSTTQFFWLTKSSEATAFDCPHFKTTVLIYTKMCDMLCCKMHLRWQFHWLVPDACKIFYHASLHIKSPTCTSFAAVEVDRGWRLIFLSFDTLLLSNNRLSRLFLLNIYAQFPMVVVDSKIRVADFHQVLPILCYKCSEQSSVLCMPKSCKLIQAFWRSRKCPEVVTSVFLAHSIGSSDGGLYMHHSVSCTQNVACK